MASGFKGPNYKPKPKEGSVFKGPSYGSSIKPEAPPQSPLDATMGFGSDVLRNINDSLSFGLFDKGLEATGLDKQARSKTENGNPVARVIGKTIGGIPWMMAGGLGLGRLVPALGRATIPSVIGNNMVTSGGYSVADQLIREGKVDPVLLAEDVATGGASGAVFGTLARGASSGARVRARGNKLSPAEKQAASAFAEDATQRGIPLTLTEAAGKIAPDKIADLKALEHSAGSSPKGSQATADFEAGRAPKVQAAGRSVADNIGPRVSPFEIQQAAAEGVKDVKTGYHMAAEPYFATAAGKKAAPNMIKHAANNDPYIKQAIKKVAKDKGLIKGLSDEFSITAQTNHVAFLDAVVQELDAKAATAFESKHGSSGKYLAAARDKVQALIDQYGKSHATGRDIASQGSSVIKELEAGPLGQLAKQSTARAQAGSLLNVGNDMEAGAARDAVKHMPTWAGKGVLANAVDEAVSRKGSGWAKDVLPTEQSRGIASEILGSGAADTMATLDAAGAVHPTPPSPHLAEPWGGPLNAVWQGVRHFGAEGVTKKLQDPKWLKKLGKVGLLQDFLDRAGASAGHSANEKRRADGSF